jgi:hypothetical protein
LVKTAALLLVMSVSFAARAQPLRVYSEFARIDAAGKVTAPAEPREILSPAIVRNGYSSFQVVVDVPKGTPYQLYVAQNPENAVVVTLYRQRSNGLLDRVEQPVAGDSTQAFWMDLWTARDAPVARIKVEPQLHVNNDWVIYPMEGRVTSAVVPDVKWEPGTGGVGPVELIRQAICSSGIAVSFPSGSGFSGQNMRYRNANQDVALAAGAPKADLQKLFGGCDAPPSPDPEWYLRIRDYLLRLR